MVGDAVLCGLKLAELAQGYFPAWRALVDGQPEPVWRANHAFQAVEVPAGTHHVILLYEDRAFGWGLLVSALTLAVCVSGWVLAGHSILLWEAPTLASSRIILVSSL